MGSPLFPSGSLPVAAGLQVDGFALIFLPKIPFSRAGDGSTLLLDYRPIYIDGLKIEEFWK